MPALDQITEFDAVRLFLERAEATGSDFAVTAQNATAAVKVCRQLDGNPLAIELAAARLRFFSVEEIAERLDDSLRLLTSDRRLVTHRHLSLQAAVDWSYQLLSEAERVLWHRLSVFAGGFTREAVEAVCGFGLLGGAEVQPLLSQLVDKSVVLPEESQGEMRYRLLEPIRQFGGEKLRASGEAEAVRDRHQTWYVQYAETTDHELAMSSGKWINRLKGDRDNFRAALAWCHASGSWVDGLRLASALRVFWDMVASVTEGRKWLSEFLACADGSERTEVRARALDAAGMLAWRQGDYDAAEALLSAG